jgi:RNA polymerase sigma-70 factor (sigma-E family)
VATHQRDAAFDAFARAATPRLRSAARLIALHQQHADDLVQHALEKTYLHWKKAEADPYTYARRTMINAATDWWRRVTRRERLVDVLPEPTGLGDPATTYADTSAVFAALAELTSKERAVLMLRYWEDLSEHEIAEALGVAPGTVKSTSNRALGKLRGSSTLSEFTAKEI